MRRAILVAALLLASAAMLGWWMHAPDPVPRGTASPPDVPAVASVAVVQRTIEPPRRNDAERFREQAGAGPPQYEVPPPDLLAPRLDALHAAAAGGDPAAMRELGTALHACLASTQDPRADQLVENLDMDLMRPAGGKPWPIENEKNAYERYHRAMAKHADCLAIGHERAATGLSWLERGARAGDEHAMLAFARAALDRAAYPTEGALLSDLDEVIRRRDLADRWMDEALERGSRQALSSAASLARSRRDMAMYQLAWNMTLERDFGERHAGELQRSLDRQSYAYIPELADDAAWAAFLADARRIAQRTRPPDG